MAQRSTVLDTPPWLNRCLKTKANLVRAFLLLVLPVGFIVFCIEMRVMEPAAPPVSMVSEIPKMPKVPPPNADAAQVPPGYRVELKISSIQLLASLVFLFCKSAEKVKDYRSALIYPVAADSRSIDV